MRYVIEKHTAIEIWRVLKDRMPIADFDWDDMNDRGEFARAVQGYLQSFDFSADLQASETGLIFNGNEDASEALAAVARGETLRKGQ